MTTTGRAAFVVIDSEERGGEPQLLELLAADRNELRNRFGDQISRPQPSCAATRTYAV